MLNFLYKRTPEVETIPKRPTLGFFHHVFRRKQMPSPGAMNMAYETLALAPNSPIGPGVQVERQINPTQRPVVSLQSSVLAGTPTQSGTMRLYPLFDPATGTYNEGFAGIDNLPFRRHEILPAGPTL